MPERIQLRRTKGFRLRKISPDAIVVARPGKWGNPCRIRGNYVYDEWGPDSDGGGHEHYAAPGEARGLAVRLFREALMADRLPFTVDDVINELAGHDLACWCAPGSACHGDVLLEIANERA